MMPLDNTSLLNSLITLLLMACPLSYLLLGTQTTFTPPVEMPPVVIEAVPSPILIDTDEIEGVIFPATYLEQSGSTVGATWTPTEDDIFQMEAGVADFLADSDNVMLTYSEVPAWERLSEYTRQYYGMTIEGSDVIHAEFFCDVIDGWQAGLIYVMDGGDCFFRLDYDPSTNTFFNLQVNGPA